jgi:hypothetical protein
MTYREAVAVLAVLVICGAPILYLALVVCSFLGCGSDAPTIVVGAIAIGAQRWVLMEWRQRHRRVIITTFAALVVDVILIGGRLIGVLPPL